ncbi:MAG TPA: formyltransferase family protein [Phycisphaerae bacterium]|nr:formyltransferase family protein [Phycisphaerae bacterium]HRY67117.1 formyltransferase family protein [Phycisphaerae bacterium]HSA26514.1 formyltransferase family protein [Phycisphaerae bacterium]
MKIGILASTENHITDFYLGNQVIRHFDVPIILVQRVRSRSTPELAEKVVETVAKKGGRALISSVLDWSFERQRQREIRQYLRNRFAELGERAEYDSGPQVVLVDSIHDRLSLQILRDAGVTALFQNGAGIIRSPLIQLARRGVVNVHHGFLPDIRGCQSIAWGLLEDRHEWIGVSVHLIDEGIDTGPILKRQHLRAVDTDTYPPLFAKATVLGGRLLVEAMHELAMGRVEVLARTSPGTYRSAMGRRHWLALARKVSMARAAGGDLHPRLRPSTGRSSFTNPPTPVM